MLKEDFFRARFLVKSFLVGAILVGAIFYSFNSVLAQEEQSAEESQEALIDSVVNLQDLGVTQSKILPDSFLYSFKRFGRNLKETLTFNSVKKQEIRLDNANKELAEAQLLVDKKPENSKAIKAVVKAVENYQSKLGEIKNEISGLKEKKQGGDKKVGILLDNILDKQIKQQKVLENIEKKIADKVPAQFNEQFVKKIQNTREKTAEYVGNILSQVEENEGELTARIDRALILQTGSEFKEIRNLELIRRIEHGITEDKRGVFEGAEEKAFIRLGERIEGLSEDDRAERFKNYARNVDGDEMYHFEVFDRLKQGDYIPQDINEKIEAAKDIVSQRFQKRVEEISETDIERGRKMIEERFNNFHQDGTDIRKMRVIEDMEHRFNFTNKELEEEVKKEKDESIERFKEAFPDATEDADRFKELSQMMAENPDPTTFRLLQQLEEKVMADPQKREFLMEMERQTKVRFAEKFEEEGDDFFDRITTNNPEDIEIFEELKRDFRDDPYQFIEPPHPGSQFDPSEFESRNFGREDFYPVGFESFFDKTVERQKENLVNSLEDIENFDRFEIFQQKLRDVPDVFVEIEARQREWQRGNEGDYNPERDFNRRFNRDPFEEFDDTKDLRDFDGPEFREPREFDRENFRDFEPDQFNDVRRDFEEFKEFERPEVRERREFDREEFRDFNKEEARDFDGPEFRDFEPDQFNDVRRDFEEFKEFERPEVRERREFDREEARDFDGPEFRDFNREEFRDLNEGASLRKFDGGGDFDQSPFQAQEHQEPISAQYMLGKIAKSVLVSFNAFSRVLGIKITAE